MPPIDTRVSVPLARASGTRYSSLRILLPPKASPELQSSRLAQTVAPPRCLVSRSRKWTGLGPNIKGYRGKSFSFTCAPPSTTGFDAPQRTPRLWSRADGTGLDAACSADDGLGRDRRPGLEVDPASEGNISTLRRRSPSRWLRLPDGFLTTSARRGHRPPKTLEEPMPEWTPGRTHLHRL